MLTGAGVSAESGVPTFRDAQTGLWARFDPLQLATPTAFAIHPKLVWDWYAWRRELVAKVQPNPAHDALVEIERRVPDCLLITQNVDDLHRRAAARAGRRVLPALVQEAWPDTPSPITPGGRSPPRP